VLLFALAYYFLMPVAEVVTVRRGTAISAVYGTVRIEPAFVVRVRAQNDGFIQLAAPFPTWPMARLSLSATTLSKLTTKAAMGTI